MARIKDDSFHSWSVSAHQSPAQSSNHLIHHSSIIMSTQSPTKTYHTTAYPAINPYLLALSSSGKNIVITGGGSGIGSSIAKAFAQSGASSIALLGRTESSLLQTKREIEALSNNTTTKVSTYVADITNPTALSQSLKSHAASHGGKLHVLVANAGFLPSNGSILDSSPQDWYAGFEINVKGTFNLLRAFLPLATEDAVVLNTSTAVAHMSHVPAMSSYAASKLAAAKVYEYLHYEHPGLFVLSVHPGTIRTSMSDKALGAKAGAGIPYDDGKCIVETDIGFVVRADVFCSQSSGALYGVGCERRGQVLEWEVCLGELGCG
jgi:NAD(P)-dependent dehydrogenase (short-subunit alcohol dehydrogenase family)